MIFQTDLFGLEPDETETAPESDNVVRYGQYFTPLWAAVELLKDLGPLHRGDHVLEPMAGRGAFLHAIPASVDATGVEIDADLAGLAAKETGRRIIVGDFATVPIDFTPSHAIGNPNFRAEDIEATITRLGQLLTPGSVAGLIVPVHSFSFGRRTIDLLKNFDVTSSLLPRDLYPRIRFALCWLKLVRAKVARLNGFLLFEEAVAVRSLRVKYRKVAETGRRPLWREVLHMALEAYGGEASLENVYRLVENARPTKNTFWRDALRREAGEHFERVRPGVFRIPQAA